MAAGGNTVQYSEQDTAVVINNGITLSDPEDTAINRVEIVLSGGGTGETLALPTNTKIEASFANNKLTLTKKGTETPTNADYQAALRTVTYENTNAATADGNRTITFTAFEGTGTTLASSGVVSTISVATLDDDAPVLDALSGTTVTFNEGGTAAVLESALTVSDVDDTNLTKAIVRISEGYGSQDKLAATATAGFTIDWTAATGILEISGDKSLADWQAILRTVTFINEDGDNPQAGTRKIDWRLYDGANYSAVKQTTVNVVAANDAPTIANVGQTAAFTEGTPVVVDSDPALGDVDSSLLKGATVTIKSYKTGDTLVFTNTDKITGTLAQSGTSNADYTLTLTGDASVSEYQTALRSVKFNNTSDTPDATNRTIEFNVTDSGNATLAAVGSATVSITAVNDAPILAAGGNTVQYSEQDTAVVINNGITLSDPEDTAVNRVEIVLAGGGTGETLALPTNTKIEASFANNKLYINQEGNRNRRTLIIKQRCEQSRMRTRMQQLPMATVRLRLQRLKELERHWHRQVWSARFQLRHWMMMHQFLMH